MRIQSINSANFKNNQIRKNNSNINSNNISCDVFQTSASKIAFGSELPSNFGTVIEEKLFRGAMPKTEEHFKALKDKGVAFILDLCGEQIRHESDMAEKFGMEYFYADGNNILTRDLMAKESDEGVKELVELIDSELEKGGAGYIHCELGRSRTGLMAAYYQLCKGVEPRLAGRGFTAHNNDMDTLRKLLKLFEDGTFKKQNS